MGSTLDIACPEKPAPKNRRVFAGVRGMGYPLFFYVLTSLVVFLGVSAGGEFFRSRDRRQSESPTLVRCMTGWDGEWYRQIVVEGYSYYPKRWSSVAFFPLYPLLARLAATLGNMSPDIALVFVAHASLAGAFVLLDRYGKQRYRGAPPELMQYILLATGLAPFTYFFRMAYSEASFFCLTILALYGIERRWSLLGIALIIGLASATRPVGVALLAPFLLHLWQRARSWARFLAASLCLLPVACWGLAAFLGYQYWRFGDPLAFASSQLTWRLRPPAPWPDKLLALELLEPIWAVFDPTSPCYWMRHEDTHFFLFHQAIFNRLAFLAGVILTVVGKYKRWLSAYEVALVAGLLLIPYVGRGYDMCMMAMARFTSVAFPIYLVMGQLLWRMPAPFAAATLGISSLLLGIYAGLFAAGYPFF
jgi:hypothetical protein